MMFVYDDIIELTEHSVIDGGSVLPRHLSISIEVFPRISPEAIISCLAEYNKLCIPPYKRTKQVDGGLTILADNVDVNLRDYMIKLMKFSDMKMEIEKELKESFPHIQKLEVRIRDYIKPTLPYHKQVKYFAGVQPRHILIEWEEKDEELESIVSSLEGVVFTRKGWIVDPAVEPTVEPTVHLRVKVFGRSALFDPEETRIIITKDNPEDLETIANWIKEQCNASFVVRESRGYAVRV